MSRQVFKPAQEAPPPDDFRFLEGIAGIIAAKGKNEEAANIAEEARLLEVKRGKEYFTETLLELKKGLRTISTTDESIQSLKFALKMIGGGEAFRVSKFFNFQYICHLDDHDSFQTISAISMYRFSIVVKEDGIYCVKESCYNEQYPRGFHTNDEMDKLLRDEFVKGSLDDLEWIKCNELRLDTVLTISPIKKQKILSSAVAEGVTLKEITHMAEERYLEVSSCSSEKNTR